MTIIDLLSFCTQDISSHLGRLNYESLSHQTRMELLINSITNKYLFCYDDEEPHDIDNWSGIALDDAGNVIKIEKCESQLEGSIALEWLPSTVQRVDLSENLLIGTLNFESLPDVLNKMFLYKNRFTGTVCLTRLPGVMWILNIGSNALSGPVDLTKLPSVMVGMCLYSNDFSGWTDFSKLPESLRTLSISDTQLEGEISPSKRLKVKATHTKIKII